jgi:hypothetical protein
MALDNQTSGVPDAELPQPIIADLAASPRRQTLLACLLGGESDDGLAVETLAMRVAAREADTTNATGDEVAAVRRSLFDDHLPKLVETGVLTYDSMLDRVLVEDPDLARAILTQ